MPEVSREEFERCYFELGGGPTTGWTRGYWDEFFVKNVDRRMRFVVEPPASEAHNRMFIVSDFQAMEYRMFFMTETSSRKASRWRRSSADREATRTAPRRPTALRPSVLIPRRARPRPVLYNPVAMHIHEALATLPGIWHGTSKLWVEPGQPLRESPSTASVEAVGGDGTLALRYTWEFDGRPQDGLLLVRLAPARGETDMVWVDSWHQRAAYLLCRGETVDTDHVTARGDYPAPTGPPRGWRIGLHMDADGRFRLLMHNISPDGDEMLAVEATYARA